MLYKKVGKPLLFRLDAERAHHLIMRGLHISQSIPGGMQLLHHAYGVEDNSMWVQECFGLTFPRPIGLAAGLDKNAQAVSALSSIGFGFMEVGTVTPKPQIGNDKPRLFRLPSDEALINRMGFNNVGVAKMQQQLQKHKSASRRIPVAVNIGKNKTTSQETAHEDYRACIRALYAEADFFVVNISSPNTPGLRNLQHGDELNQLLQAVQQEMQLQHMKEQGKAKPIVVKLSPDLQDDELQSAVHSIVNNKISGIVATNTTLSRDGLQHQNKDEQGGLSGKPITHKSTEMIRKIYQMTEGKIPIIGSGGVFTAQDVYAKIRAGASLVEIYTSLIYEGPEIVRELHIGLERLMRKDGVHHISQVIGADHHGIHL
jgi:dihydroorotate dehydrogenase